MYFDLRLAFVAAAALTTLHANAASLQASPISINVDPERGAATLTLKNTDDVPVQAQVRLFRWTQADNKDVLEPTEEVLASPPFASIKANGTQLVRVVLTDPASSAPERSYRILVDEIPNPEATPKGITVNFRYSIPVRVVRQADASVQPKLVSTWVADGASLVLTLRNEGTGRAQISAVSANGSGTEGTVLEKGLLGYVLPGAERTWVFSMPTESLAKATRSFTARVNGMDAKLVQRPD